MQDARRIEMLEKENTALRARINSLILHPPDNAHSPSVIGTEASLNYQSSETSSIDIEFFRQKFPGGDAKKVPQLSNTKKKKEIKQIIGKGSFGIVYLTKHNGRTSALKIVPNESRHENREADFIRLFMKKSPHNIVPFYECTEIDESLHIYMAYVSKTLRTVLTNLQDKDSKMRVHVHQVIFAQIARGLCFLHSYEIAHRDLKPENILVDDSTINIYICDFGCSKQMFTSKHHKPSTTYMCSRFYRAPELILDRNLYGVSVDMWSFGCILIEACTGMILFMKEDNITILVEHIRLLGNIVQADIDAMPSVGMMADYECPQIPPRVSQWNRLFKKRTLGPHYEDLCKKLLVYNPKTRLNAEQAAHSLYLDEAFSLLEKQSDTRPFEIVRHLRTKATTKTRNIFDIQI